MTRTAGTSKQASGLMIYLVEELGDARLRCAQLKKYLKEVLDLIEKSESRDHFFEVAGHLIQGIPDVVLRLDNALDAAALSASRLDYEEIKNGLLPEKAEALENVLQDNRLRYLRRRSNEEDMRTAMTETITRDLENAYRAGAKQKGSHEELALAVKQLTYEATRATETPFQSSMLGNVPKGSLQRIADRVWEVAFYMGAAFTTSPKTAANTKDPMNAKTAAEMLTQLADQTEKAGGVPTAPLMTLVAQLEGQDRTASSLAPKAAQAFRDLARELTVQKNPSRVRLAGVLRRILADTMPMAGGCPGCSGQCGQPQAPMAGAGEDFQKANPKITDEDAAKIDEMHDEHKDVVKDRQAAVPDGPMIGFQVALETAKATVRAAYMGNERLACRQGLGTIQNMTAALAGIAPESRDALLAIGAKAMHLLPTIKSEAAQGDVLQRTATDDAFLAAYPVSEEIESRFEEGRPADPTQEMSPEDAKEWKQNTETYRDSFKA